MKSSIESILERISDAFSPIPCVRAVVLGGSRATGTAGASSDVDVGLYYDPSSLDLPALNRAAQQLDDAHRSGLIGPPGSWGEWVDCGGWLTVGGMSADVILRDITRVEACVNQTDEGDISMHYQTGHPHAYLNVMYRGELALSRTLCSRSREFDALKRRAKAYPDALAHALIGFFLFEAGFSRDLAQKALAAQDPCVVCGQMFRAVSALNQVLFAANRTYCLNEKKAAARLEGLSRTPPMYRARVERIFERPACSEAIDLLDSLLTDARRTAQDA